MVKAAAIVFLATLATPALAVGDAFDGAPWWVPAAFVAPVVLVFVLLAAGFGFFLQGFLRLRNALFLIALTCSGFLALLASSAGSEKFLRVLPIVATLMALVVPLFGLGWFIGIRNATRRFHRAATFNTGSHHG